MTDNKKTTGRKKYQRPRGTYDLFGRRLGYFKKVEMLCRKMALSYGFQEIQTPAFEGEELFRKGVGTGTDIVEKEMYTLEQGKNKLALRPEATAPIVRAYIEHGMNSWPKPVRLWCFGSFFRHERPQSGRYRQFRQFNAEVLGSEEPVTDARVIQFFYALLQELGFKDLKLYVNSIGCPRCRKRYLGDLREFFSGRKKELCADCKKRLRKNVLRIFDCKEKKCQAVVDEAPQILNALWKKCRVHLRQTLEFLDALDLPYNLDPFLVRGLDYYTRTVFEIAHGKDEALSLVGGGRYDELVKLLGGRSTPACGGAMGIERVVDLMVKKKMKPLETDCPRIFLAQVGISAKQRGLGLFEELRKAGVFVAEDFSQSALSSQLKKANKLGVEYSLILGKKELADGEIIIRDMEKETQKKIKLEKVVQELKKRL